MKTEHPPALGLVFGVIGLLAICGMAITECQREPTTVAVRPLAEPQAAAPSSAAEAQAAKAEADREAETAAVIKRKEWEANAMAFAALMDFRRWLDANGGAGIVFGVDLVKDQPFAVNVQVKPAFEMQSREVRRTVAEGLRRQWGLAHGKDADKHIWCMNLYSQGGSAIGRGCRRMEVEE